ncbi:hypothetical protein ACPZ19_00635 [Amycolatopsis lurida]|uniref:hypothetical protein n=1 Tax=Amycolatopsis sp. YIM 10 TaxID=2653857 RepID=UPI0012903BC8|nr:hypothetical protein YIM_00405 [Amycolatopsis sp. YIM 10]
MEFLDSIPTGRTATVSPVRASVPRAVPQAVDPRSAHLRRHEGGQTVWRVQCGDLINRERCVTVFVDDSQVVLVGPPGETARMTGSQLGQLRTALNEAAKLAER